MAATNTTRFSDQQYRNWLKDTLCQLYLKQALEHIVDADAVKFHQSLQKALGVFGAAPMTCFNCTQTDMRKDFRQQKWSITCRLCDQWLQQIVQNHANQPLPNLNRENTDPQLWPTNPYEVFKCYMPFGCQQDQSAKDADSQSILNVLKNCVYFGTCGRIGRLDLVDKGTDGMRVKLSAHKPGLSPPVTFVTDRPKALLEIRNSLFHSGNFLVANPKLQADMQTMLAFLKGLTALSGVEQNAVDEAIDKIQQLQANKIDLSLNRELELQALQQQQIALEKDLGTHRTKLTAATAKGAATDLAVKAIQTELGTHSTKLTAATAKGAATDLAVKAIQTELGTHSTKLTAATAKGAATDLAVKAIQTELGTHSTKLTAATAKGAATDLAVKAIQTELGTHSTKLTAATAKGAATDLAVKAIQTELGTHSTKLTAATAKGAATDLAVKAIQTKLSTHSTKLTTVFSEVKSLQKDVRSATATELDVKTLTEKTKGLELRMQKLQVVRDKFARFLQANDLEQDVGKLSHTIEQHGQRIQTLEEQTQAQRSELESCKRTLCDHEEELKTKRLKTGSETGQMTEADIAALQKRLIEYYRTMFLTDPEDDVGLNLVYVDPDIRVLREKDPSRGLVSVEDQAGAESQCRRLFQTNDNNCKQIYITGDAGSGKSMFCKHLVSLWCEAHGNSAVNATSNRDCSENGASRLQIGDSNRGDERKFGQHANNENKKIMYEFPLLFYITLRDVSDMYHVEAMIDDQIFQQNEDTKHFKASVVLKKCCCLVILDGLDEWVCPTNVKPLRGLNPGIPGRNLLNKSNVFLTTTRPWKLDVLCQKRSEIYIDKHVELVGFNSVASKTLYSQLCHLFNKPEMVDAYGSFCAKLKKRGMINTPHNIPVILTQLMCLCLDGQDLSPSQVHMYCSMLEMLLKRSDKNMPDPTCTASPKTEHSGKLLPACFSQYPVCQTHQHLLDNLCKVAFEALFNEEKEKSLVFKSSQMPFGVNQKDIDLCLNSGILSQNKVLGKRSVHEKRMSFLHKKLQEFLAAIFITNSEGGENVLSRVKSYCSTVEKVLEMSQTCMFVSGLNTEVSCKLLTCFINHVVCNDTAVQQYRQNTDAPDDTCIRSIQTCIVDCSVEALNNQHTDSLPLHDFIIEAETISECLKRLLTSNISAVKSVFIHTARMTSDNVEFVDRTQHQLQDTQCLQKLYLDDSRKVISDKTLSKTITNNSNLSSLVLRYISLNTETPAAVCGALKHLTALRLTNVELPHKERQLLVSSVSQAASLRQLTLKRLRCTDHGDDCSPVDISQLNTSCLQDVTLSWVTIQESHLHQFIRQLSSVSHEVMVELEYVTVTADSENPVDLSYLTHDRCLVVTRLVYDDRNNTWHIDFHTQQQTTT